MVGTDCDVRAAVERPEEDAVDFLIAAREEAIYRERCAEACTEVLSPHKYFPAGDEAGRSLAASRQETIIKPQIRRASGPTACPIPVLNSCSAIDLKRTGVDSEAIEGVPNMLIF